MSEQLEPLATEAGQQAIVRAINNLSSLEYAVRAEHAATAAAQSADDALTSATNASNSETKARDWAEKINGAVETETIVTPPETEGDPPTEELVSYFSAKYWAQMAEDYFSQMTFDTVPTEDSTNGITSGAVYDALATKQDTLTFDNAPTQSSDNPVKSGGVYTALAGKQDTLTIDSTPTQNSTNPVQSGGVYTALSNVQSSLTFDDTPTSGSNNPVKSGGIYTALSGKQDTLTIDSAPTQNSTNPVQSGGVYTAIANATPNITTDTEPTEDSDNLITSGAIWEALQNFTPSGGGGGGAGNASGMYSNVLWEKTDSSTTGNITLNDSIDEYDLIQFFTWRGSSDPYTSSFIILKDELKKCTGTTSSSKHFLMSGYDNRLVRCAYINNTTLNIYGIEGNEWVYKIVGIKFSKNLSEQMYSNVLYEGNWTTGNITLSDNISNYDLIQFIPNNGGNEDERYNHPQIITSNWVIQSSSSKPIELMGEGGRFFAFYYSNDNTLTYSDRSTLGVRKIYGIKLAKGGYSGIVSDARMTVKSGHFATSGSLSVGSHEWTISFDSPMPDTNYVVNFSYCGTQIDYWDTTHWSADSKTVNGFKLWCYASHSVPATIPLELDWIAIRPNSYTREGMVEDVLFSNASGVNSGTINLSGNISDYDLIMFETNRSGQNNSLNQNRNIFTASSLAELTGNTAAGNCILLTGYNDDFLKLTYINDNTLNAYAAVYLKLLKITGIKFGRYVSGVAVDTTVTQNSNAVVTSGAVYDALQNISSGGGGGSITVDSTITQGSTNPVQGGAIYTALDNKADAATTLNGYGITDAYTKTEVDTAVASKGDVTTNTDQNITGTKTFVGSKKVAFKQSTSNDKLGFTLYGNTGTERGYLEFNPTNTVDGVTGLMTLGNYATSAAGLTQVGFRRYSNISGASGAYNLLMPLISDARTPFSLTTTYTNFYLPLGFTNGTTTVTTAKSGVVDLSPLLASLEARVAALEGN